MKKIIFSFLIIIGALFSYCYAQNNALNYYDKIVAIQKSVIAKIEIRKDSTQKAMIEINNFLNLKLKELKKIKAISGGETFKQAVINDIELMSIILQLVIKLKATNITKHEKDAIYKQIKPLFDRSEAYHKEALIQQEKFAKNKGLNTEN